LFRDQKLLITTEQDDQEEQKKKNTWTISPTSPIATIGIPKTPGDVPECPCAGEHRSARTFFENRPLAHNVAAEKCVGQRDMGQAGQSWYACS
jgi:hypothetical protein